MSETTPNAGWRESMLDDIEAEIERHLGTGINPHPETGRCAEAIVALIERATDQAWRNGWGSALNCLRGTDQLVREESAKTMTSDGRPSQRIILNMVGQWVDLIDGLTEDIFAKCCEIGVASKGEDGGRDA